MTLHPPFEISALRPGGRLLPSLRIGDGVLSLEPTNLRAEYGKPVWRWYVEIPAGLFHGTDLSGWNGIQGMFGDMLVFLGAAAESYAYGLRTGEPGEHADLFPAPVVEWAHQHSDEISMLCLEIEESETPLIVN